MRIQIINQTGETSDKSVDATVSKLSNPFALDDFDLDVVFMTDERIWKNKTDSTRTIKTMADFNSLRLMVENKKKANVLFVLPRNVKFLYHFGYLQKGGEGYKGEKLLKDMLPDLCGNILPGIIPFEKNKVFIAFERTKTLINGKRMPADFYFLQTSGEMLTYSESSEKPTTIKIDNDVYITTLALKETRESIVEYYDYVIKDNSVTDAPQWMDCVHFFDDQEQIAKIEESQRVIAAQEDIIEKAQARIAENSRYKSILYANGEELEEVVRDILGKLLDYPLKEFKDNKKEDFLVETPKVTFIGEIKGVAHNVKRGNIAQINQHYQDYLDDIEEMGKEENVKQLLIINPLRDKPIEDRESINSDILRDAKRNHCLIIETKTLLSLFDLFRKGEIDTAECIELFAEKDGLLRLKK